MKMVNMKKTSEQKKRDVPSVIAESEYPYGLKINIDNDQCELLGFDELPEVGEVFEVSCKVYVCNTSENENEYENYKSMSLQITDMGISKKGNSTDTAKALYKEKE